MSWAEVSQESIGLPGSCAESLDNQCGDSPASAQRLRPRTGASASTANGLGGLSVGLGLKLVSDTSDKPGWDAGPALSSVTLSPFSTKIGP